jgi:hypothetical protein
MHSDCAALGPCEYEAMMALYVTCGVWSFFVRELGIGWGKAGGSFASSVHAKAKNSFDLLVHSHSSKQRQPLGQPKWLTGA